MRITLRHLLPSLLISLLPTHVSFADVPPKEITLKGSLVCNGSAVPSPKQDDHTFVLFVIDGAPEIRAEVDRLMKDFYPEKGLDLPAAEKLMAQFDASLKYHLDPASPALKDPKPKAAGHYCMPATASAVKGTISEKDGRKWITATKIEPTKLTYPKPMLEPDRPFVMPDQQPIELKIDEKLSLKCVPIPPGKFLMGTPVWMWPYFVEEYPHPVTLTKTFWLAEIPVTQSMYEALMGDNPSKIKDPELPVQDPPFAAIDAFCKKLSEKTARKVRLPTDAEWEYAARVGTSNPTFKERYADQFSGGGQGFKSPLKVKQKKPNAWGLYDMASCWWEITADKGMYNVRKPETDPAYPPPADNPRAQRSGRGIVMDNWSMGTHEFITEKGYAGQKFRVLVEGPAEK